MKKKGFTLAEVLITLIIIGIIAAITIPIVHNNHQKRELYSKFMKTYSTLNQAMNMSFALGNAPTGVDFYALDGNKTNAQQFLDTYIRPYVNVIGVKSCLGIGESDTPYKDLTGNVFATACQLQSSANISDALILSDGTAIAVVGQGFENFVQIIVDVNASKGPNTMGRDINVFRYWGKMAKPIITGCAHNGNGEFDESYYSNNCNPQKSGSGGTVSGDACADRLLREGKMNY